MIGGTAESARLAIALAAVNIPCTVTVTTSAARSLYPPSPILRVWVGYLSAVTLDSFLHEEGIVAILDASHPYAVEISKLAIAASIEQKIPYLRYERPALTELPKNLTPNPSPPEERGAGAASEGGVRLFGNAGSSSGLNIIYLDSFDTLITGNYLQGQRVLLTLGYRTLPLFSPWQDKATLFARILPSLTALEAALASGFTPDRLIAMRPPVSAELEKALWRQWEISLVVTKASGSAGGEDVKRIVAAELGVKLVVIVRPEVDYPQQTSDLSVALDFCQLHISSGFPPS